MGVTLADEDTNSILTDIANRAIQGNVTMQLPTLEPIQLAPPSHQILNKCKWCPQVAKCITNASSAIWWPNLQPIQVANQVAKFTANASSSIW